MQIGCVDRKYVDKESMITIGAIMSTFNSQWQESFEFLHWVTIYNGFFCTTDGTCICYSDDTGVVRNIIRCDTSECSCALGRPQHRASYVGSTTVIKLTQCQRHSQLLLGIDDSRLPTLGALTVVLAFGAVKREVFEFTYFETEHGCGHLLQLAPPDLLMPNNYRHSHHLTETKQKENLKCYASLILYILYTATSSILLTSNTDFEHLFDMR